MEIKRPPSAQPIPEHAKCVFGGEIFDVYQWQQKMFDGSTTTFEKLKRSDSVIVFPVLENGNILLTKQEQPGKELFVGAPGGRVDPGENIFAAAKRELLEETGCVADTYTLFKSKQPLSKIEWAVYVFIAKGVKKVADLNLDPGEKIEVIEYDFDAFLDIANEESFDGHEIRREVWEAKKDPIKKEALRKNFSV